MNPLSEGPTPEHLRWTLVRACPLRELSDIESPEQTERLLRAARAHAEALRDRRVVGDVTLSEETLGDSVDDAIGFNNQSALAVYGGWDRVAACCEDCPARAGVTAASCFGFVALPLDLERKLAFRETCRDIAIMVDAASGTELAKLTDPWSSVWMLWREKPSLHPALVKFVDLVFGMGVGLDSHRDHCRLFDLQRSMRIAASAPETSLQVTLHPAGRIEGRTWTTLAHCVVCKSTWPDARRQHCEICGAVGGRQPERKRKRAGTRPYRPLLEFLSREEAARILAVARESRPS